MAKQKMRETVLEQSKQENRNEEENCRRTGGFFDPIYHAVVAIALKVGDFGDAEPEQLVA